jgi:predicted kinase
MEPAAWRSPLATIASGQHGWVATTGWGEATLAVFTGAPCSGKSTLAEAAAARLGAPVLAWDWAMAALTWCEPVQDTVESLDRPTQRRIGWTILTNLAEAQLRHGRSVVLDGVARDDHVAAARDLAQRYDARSIVVLTTCDDRDWLRARTDGRRRAIPGWHELTWDHVGSFRWELPADVDHTVDTSHDPDPHRTIARILPRARPVR